MDSGYTPKMISRTPSPHRNVAVSTPQTPARRACRRIACSAARAARKTPHRASSVVHLPALVRQPRSSWSPALWSMRIWPRPLKSLQEELVGAATAAAAVVVVMAAVRAATIVLSGSMARLGSGLACDLGVSLRRRRDLSRACGLCVVRRSVAKEAGLVGLCPDGYTYNYGKWCTA